MNQTNQMETKKNILFWNVDTQYDFMRDDESFKGALPIKDARQIEDNLEALTKITQRYEVDVVNTADWHTHSDAEIDFISPDFKETYPPHCMTGTKGAEYVPATKPENAQIISWQDKNYVINKTSGQRNLVLYKNNFDVFKGNPHTDKVLKELNPDMVFVYGVATNVCVNFAVQGLVDRLNKAGKKYELYVVEDAIKELPKELAATPLEKILDSWEDLGVKFIDTQDTHRIVRRQHYRNIMLGLKNDEAYK